MLTATPIVDTLILAALAALVAVPSALLMRIARPPGGQPAAGLLGGALAGLLLSLALGAAAPEIHEKLFVGARAERQALEQAERQNAIDITAMINAGVTPIAIEEHRRITREQESDLELQWRIALRSHSRLTLAAAGIFFALLALSAPLRSAGRGAPRTREPADRAILAGLLTFIVAGALTALLARWLLDSHTLQAAAFATSLAAGPLCISLRARLVGAPARARNLDLSGAALYTFAAAALCIIVAVADRDLLASVIFTAALGAAGWIALLTGWRPRAPIIRRTLIGLTSALFAPAIVALALAPMDLPTVLRSLDFAIAAVIATILSDGRWIGAWLAWWTIGPDAVRNQASRRAAAISASNIGVIQIIAALALHRAGAMSDPILAGVIVGAIVIELTSNLRTRLSRSLDPGGPPLFNSEPPTSP